MRYMVRQAGIPPKEEVIRLMAELGSDIAIGSHLGVARQTVMRWRRKYDLVYRSVPVEKAA